MSMKQKSWGKYKKMIKLSFVWRNLQCRRLIGRHINLKWGIEYNKRIEAMYILYFECIWCLIVVFFQTNWIETKNMLNKNISINWQHSKTNKIISHCFHQTWMKFKGFVKGKWELRDKPFSFSWKACTNPGNLNFLFYTLPWITGTKLMIRTHTR